MMRCCKHCGALLEDDATICNFCGAALEVPKFEPAPEKVAVAEAPVQEVTEAPTKKPFSKKKLFITIGIAIGVIAMAVAVLLLFFNPHVAVSKYEAVLNGEFDKFNASIIMYNTAFDAYANFYNRNHMPRSRGTRFIF